MPKVELTIAVSPDCAFVLKFLADLAKQPIGEIVETCVQRYAQAQAGLATKMGPVKPGLC